MDFGCLLIDFQPTLNSNVIGVHIILKILIKEAKTVTKYLKSALDFPQRHNKLTQKIH